MNVSHPLPLVAIFSCNYFTSSQIMVSGQAALRCFSGHSESMPSGKVLAATAILVEDQSVVRKKD